MPTRDNLEVRANAVINVRCDDLQAGEGGAELANALRGRYQAQEQNPTLLYTLGQQHLGGSHVNNDFGQVEKKGVCCEAFQPCCEA